MEKQEDPLVVIETVVSQRAAIVVGVFILLFVWEVVWPSIPRFKETPRQKWRHVGRNVLMGIINATFASAFLGIIGIYFLNLATSHGFGILQIVPTSLWLHTAITFLTLDFWMYFWHRWNHTWPFLWRFHRMHHSDASMDVTTSLRFHLIEVFFSNVLQIGIIVLLGSQLWQLVAYSIAFSIVVQLHHSNVRFPEWIDAPLRLLIATPGMHRIHHSRIPHELNSNYSSVFSIWDRIMGTFRYRKNASATDMGLNGYDTSDYQTLKGMIETPFKRGGKYEG